MWQTSGWQTVPTKRTAVERFSMAKVPELTGLLGVYVWLYFFVGARFKIVEVPKSMG